jgi:hypothetical protein
MANSLKKFIVDVAPKIEEDDDFDMQLRGTFRLKDSLTIKWVVSKNYDLGSSESLSPDEISELEEFGLITTRYKKNYDLGSNFSTRIDGYTNDSKELVFSAETSTISLARILIKYSVSSLHPHFDLSRDSDALFSEIDELMVMQQDDDHDMFVDKINRAFNTDFEDYMWLPDITIIDYICKNHKPELASKINIKGILESILMVTEKIRGSREALLALCPYPLQHNERFYHNEEDLGLVLKRKLSVQEDKKRLIELYNSVGFDWTGSNRSKKFKASSKKNFMLKYCDGRKHQLK